MVSVSPMRIICNWLQEMSPHSENFAFVFFANVRLPLKQRSTRSFLPSTEFLMPKQAISSTPNSQPWDWNLPKLFMRRCREKGIRTKIADSTGSHYGERLLLRSLVLRRIFVNKVLDADEKFVGVLLPPTVPAAVTNLALGWANVLLSI